MLLASIIVMKCGLLRMKGIVEIEFIISVFVFITSVSFVTLVIVSNIPLLHNTASGENLKAMSYQYSEMLVFDEGYPTTWSSGNFADARRLGFSSGKRYFVDINKITKFNTYCTDPFVGYDAMKGLLGIDNSQDITVEAIKLNGTALVGSETALCEPPVASRLRQQFTTTRLGVLATGEIVKIRVTLIS